MSCSHGKRHDKGTSGSAAQDKGGHYSSQLCVLDYGLSEMRIPENSRPSTAVDVQTANQLVVEGGISKSSCDIKVLAEIFLRLAKKGYRSAVSQLVEVIHDSTFDLNIFQRIIKNLKDGDEFFCKSGKESIKDNEIERGLVKYGGGVNEGHSTLHVKNVCDVFEGLV